MTPERWREVKAIFLAALERSADERGMFLDAACGSDEALRDEIRSLFAAHGHAPDFLEAPPPTFGAAVGAIATMSVGRRIGAWTIVRELGHGGMGTVYLVERADAEFQQRGAIKVARGFADEALLHRFVEERRILAALDHPHIARLVDGGTTEGGMPYVVMEYVEGLPIETFCAANRLDARQRVELFRRVCAAIHYAHQRLVIHRDIKGSNILVTRDGAPKLLDFGIAKILDPERPHESTRTLLRMATPESASPEQIRGEAITTASDVYALGVLLYRLLTGRSPYRRSSESTTDLIRAVCEQTPEPPSVAARSSDASEAGTRFVIDRDLDVIVLKALRKEPERRYNSAEQLSDDLGRWLTGHPVLAAPDSRRYRAVKFVGRHRAFISLTAAALALIVLAGGVAVYQARIAQRERTTAERRFNDVRQLATSFLFDFHDAIENLPGSTQARALIVTKALQYLESLERDAAGDPALQRELAAAYERLGDVQGRPIFASLGRTGDAAASYKRALAIRERLLEEHPAELETQRGLQSSYLAMGRILARNGDTAAAIESYRRAIVLGEALVRRHPRDEKAEASLARVYIYLGDALSRRGDAEGARREFHRGLAIDERHLAGHPGSPLLLANVSGDYDRLGYLSLRMGDPDQALAYYQRTLAINERLAAGEPENFVYRRNVALTYSRLGEVHVRRREFTRGLEYQRKSLALRETNYRADPANAQAIRDLMVINEFIGNTLLEMGSTAEALGHYRRALELAELRGRSDTASAQVQVDIGNSTRVVGRALAKLGSAADAIRFHRRSVDIFEKLTRRDPTNTEWQSDLALACSAMGEAYVMLATRPDAKRGDALATWDTARRWYVRSLDIWRRLETGGTLAGGSLGGNERAAIQDVTRGVERCDLELARLRPSARAGRGS